MRNGLAATYDHLTACLVTDVAMPGMSGFDLTERLVALGYKVPVIVVSGCSNERTEARISHAQIHMMANAGHACFWNDAATYNKSLQEFVEAL